MSYLGQKVEIKRRPDCAWQGCNSQANPKNRIKTHNGTLFYCDKHNLILIMHDKNTGTEPVQKAMGEATVPRPCKLQRSVKRA